MHAHEKFQSTMLMEGKQFCVGDSPACTYTWGGGTRFSVRVGKCGLIAYLRQNMFMLRLNAGETLRRQDFAMDNADVTDCTTKSLRQTVGGKGIAPPTVRPVVEVVFPQT